MNHLQYSSELTNYNSNSNYGYYYSDYMYYNYSYDYLIDKQPVEYLIRISRKNISELTNQFEFNLHIDNNFLLWNALDITKYVNETTGNLYLSNLKIHNSNDIDYFSFTSSITSMEIFTINNLGQLEVEIYNLEKNVKMPFERSDEDETIKLNMKEGETYIFKFSSKNFSNHEIVYSFNYIKK